jgi:hypothetical protein
VAGAFAPFALAATGCRGPTAPRPRCAAQAPVLEAAAVAFERAYVRADAGGRAGALLRGASRDGRYARLCAAPHAFAAALTADLRRVTGDGHIVVERSGAGAPDDENWIAEWLRRGPSVGWGVAEASGLAGGVGYLRLTSFYPLASASGPLSDALRALGDARALVLDLRGNGGGDDETANALIASLLDDERAVLVYRDRAGAAREVRAEHVLPARRFGAARPLAILLDRRSFSAAEAVAYVLRAERGARIFGEPTGGGANVTTVDRALPHGFRLGVPDLMPVQPRTGTNWEGRGVTPDVFAPGDLAPALAIAWARERADAGGPRGAATPPPLEG